MDEDGSSPSLVRGVPTGRVGCAEGVAEATSPLKSLGGAFGGTPPSLASARRLCLRLASLMSLSNPSAHTLQRSLMTSPQRGHSGRLRPPSPSPGRMRSREERGPQSLGAVLADPGSPSPVSQVHSAGTLLQEMQMYGPPSDGRQIEVLNGVAAVALAAVQ